MSDNEFDNNQAPAGGAAPEGGEGPQVGVLAQYVKDLSFENPNAPMSLQTPADQNAPGIDVNVNVGARQAGEDVYEVELKISATAKHTEEATAFVVELVYGSLFGMRGVPEEAMQAFLLVQAPTLMFPYARRIISDATRDGGFPPLLLEPISFEALYRQQLAQAQAQGGAGETAGDPAPINLN